MSERLTNDIRGKIVNAVLKHKYYDKCEALRLRLVILADDFYKDIFSKKERDLMESLPKGWLPTRHDFRIATEGGKHQELDFCGYGYHADVLVSFHDVKPERIYRRFPENKDNNSPQKIYSDDAIIIATARDMFEEREELLKEISNDRQRLTGIIERHTTVKKLIDSWPEIEPFIPVNEKPKPKLPALPVADLNAHFELPVE